MTYATASTLPAYATSQQYGQTMPMGGIGGALGGIFGGAGRTVGGLPPLQAQQGVLAPEDQIHPQEHLVNPMSFWSKVARIGLRYGVPIARQVLSGLEYQQQIAQQQVTPQQYGQVTPMGGIGGAVGGLPPLQAQQGVLAPEDQIHPQEHLVNPMGLWSKVARIGLRYGVPIARQVLSGLEYQQQIAQQQIAQQQVTPQQYGQMAPMGLIGDILGPVPRRPGALLADHVTGTVPFLPFQAQQGVLAPEDRIHPQEHLVNPMGFWSKLGQIGLRYGLPVVKEVLNGLEYQQQIAQQQSGQVPGQQMPIPAGIGF